MKYILLISHQHQLMTLLIMSSGVQKRTFGFDRDGLDFNITLLAWLYVLYSWGEFSLWDVVTELFFIVVGMGLN